MATLGTDTRRHPQTCHNRSRGLHERRSGRSPTNLAVADRMNGSCEHDRDPIARSHFAGGKPSIFRAFFLCRERSDHQRRIAPHLSPGPSPT